MSHRIALYAGSFDPYTNGHHAIVRKAAMLFDEVFVLIGINVNKSRSFDAEAMRRAIQKALDDDGLTNVQTVIHDGLVADFCAGHSVGWYVRGLRNAADFDFEENTARVNRMLNPALETIYLRSDDPALSSSVVRELLAFGRDVSEFVPVSVLEQIEERKR